MTKDKAVQAVFGTPVTASVEGDGLITLNPSMAIFPYGTRLRCEAVPAAGSYFAWWPPGGANSENPWTLTIGEPNPAISAVFMSLNAQYATLTLHCSGGGRITANPPANVYPLGQAITLTAWPEPDQQFLGWTGDAAGSDNPLLITLAQAKTITANFSASPRLKLERLIGPFIDEGLRFTLTGLIGERYRLDVSTNLNSWSELQTFTNNLGALQWTEPPPTNSFQRFYRAQWLSPK